MRLIKLNIVVFLLILLVIALKFTRSNTIHTTAPHEEVISVSSSPSLQDWHSYAARPPSPTSYWPHPILSLGTENEYHNLVEAFSRAGCPLTLAQEQTLYLLLYDAAVNLNRAEMEMGALAAGEPPNWRGDNEAAVQLYADANYDAFSTTMAGVRELLNPDQYEVLGEHNVELTQLARKLWEGVL